MDYLIKYQTIMYSGYTRPQLQKRCKELNIKPCGGKNITNKRLIDDIVKYEREHVDILSNLPLEILIKNVITTLDPSSLLAYCHLNRETARQCEDVRVWQSYIKGIDH